MRPHLRVQMFGLIASLALVASAEAQPSNDPAPRPSPAPNPRAECPPDVRGAPPTVGGPNAPNLSERLGESKGVICPPADVDPDAEIKPPAGGELKVIPPPGSPGGDPKVQPK